MGSTGDAVAIRRPQRWDEPFDSSMDDTEVSYLRTRPPFSGMQANVFPASTPLDGILRNDCRIHRVTPGELIVREGDYGNSAFLVLAGTVRVFLSHLNPEQVGQATKRTMGWGQAISQLFRLPKIREARKATEVTPSVATRLATVDDRPAIFLQDFNGLIRENQTLQLGIGELFGEVAAMYRSPQTATVVADSEATLVEIRWQGLRLLRRDKSFSDQLEQHYRAHWLKVHLREIPLLRDLPEENLERVCDATIMRSYGRMEWNAQYKKARELPPDEQIETEPVVATEGHLPTDLIIIRSGFARICHVHGAGHQTSAYLGKGQIFGLQELAHNVLRPASAPPVPLQRSMRAVGFLDTLRIPIEIFMSDILPHIPQCELPPPVQTKARDSDTLANPSSPSENNVIIEGENALPTGLLEFVVQHRLNNGRQAMVIDLHRCTRCDECVKACATTHSGNPRFARKGPEYDRLQFTQSCMHCTDPVCMIGCPSGAISRNDLTGTVSVHEPICIGCGTCANSCPYGNIQMTEVRDNKGRFFRDESSGLPILKATKCDLCQTQPSGPSCVNSCPHDALERMDLGDVDAVGKYLKGRGIS